MHEGQWDGSVMPSWEHFSHDADIGVVGHGPTKAEAFRQAAIALTAVVTDPGTVMPKTPVEIECRAPNDEILLVEWLNALIYEMVEYGYGTQADLEAIEEHGCMPNARPEWVSSRAKRRQQDEMGTLGSGNHYLEVQRVAQVYDATVARLFGLQQDDVVVSIHCGSRGLGHQIGTEFLGEMAIAGASLGVTIPDRELACAPVESELGQRYLGAMRAGINCALANRQIITHLVRRAFAELLPSAELVLLYDVSHNTCKLEEHECDGTRKPVFVHRKGATRSLGPGHPDLPPGLRSVGQPVLIGGTMGTASHILVGTSDSERMSFSSSCHGAGRAMSRHEALKRWKGRQVVDDLAARGIIVRSPSSRGVAEEAPGAYKDVDAVVDAADRAGLSRKVARLEPLVCVKG